MARTTRRNFLKLGGGSLAALAGHAALGGVGRGLHAAFNERLLKGALTLRRGGRDFSPRTGKERKAIPSSCWQCVTRDGIIGYVEDGRVVKIAGNPALPRTRGKLCARGQGGASAPYDPDRLLYPLKRVGKRGEHKWEKISWDEALTLLVEGGTIAGRRVKGLRALREEGKPELFMFHYGRMKGSDSKIVKSFFLAAYGTKTIGNHTSICESAKWTAQELTWGSHYDNWDLERTRIILNFGSNVLEAHTNHIPMAQRCIDALNRGVEMYTFDVRLSNTAARSTEWIPVRPGTDLAVVLAMCNVLIRNDLVDKEFIRVYTNVSLEELREHLAGYTPQWAEGISGVPAKKIEAIALKYGRTRPGVCSSYRGAAMHYNGVQTERAILMLEALAGNIDVPGGRCRAIGAKWKYKYPKPKTKARKLHILDGKEGEYAYPTHHSSHDVLPMIQRGPERPYIYMTYCYNPAYTNPDCRTQLAVLKDETLIPFLVAVDVAMSETAELADLVLPDTTYLERWAWDDMVSPEQRREYYIRQPMHPPLGEARNFPDVVCELARRLGLDLGFSSAEEFVRHCCEVTPGVKEAGGFEYMKRHGVWYDEAAEPIYRSHEKVVDVSDAAYDEATGVYYRKKEGDRDFASLDSKHAAKQYVAQRCGDGTARRGFPPDKHRWKTGLFEIRSAALAKKGFPALPSWMPIPEHRDLGPNQLILTTYKVNVQTHSRTQNCKFLTELYHDNPAWMNPRTARKLGIADGQMIRVRSRAGEIEIRTRLTEAIVPGVLAISFHCGHWAYGEYASGRKTKGHVCEPDCDYKWWKATGVHPNWVIENVGDPISGAQRWMDTVVTVSKA